MAKSDVLPTRSIKISDELWEKAEKKSLETLGQKSAGAYIRFLVANAE